MIQVKRAEMWYAHLLLIRLFFCCKYLSGTCHESSAKKANEEVFNSMAQMQEEIKMYAK